MSDTLCIYHGSCADGFTAAWAVRRSFLEDGLAVPEFYPGVYGAPPPDVSKYNTVIFVDFSYKRPVLEAMKAQVPEIMIFDHHKSAEEELRGLADSQCIVEFDMNRSGAQIAWDSFVGVPAETDTGRPLLVDYVGDRDLWQFKLPYSREVNAYIFAHEYTFENWDMLNDELRHLGVDWMAVRGAAIEKKHHKDVAELVKATKRFMVIGGYLVPVANIPYTMASDAGHLMAQEHPFAACYYDTKKHRIFSLRSTDKGMDVSEIARQYGGGGHRNAAGFEAERGWEGDSTALFTDNTEYRRPGDKYPGVPL